MFKQTAAILLISLFILTQYGRQAAYLQCKIENLSSKSNTPACDCEKSNDLAKEDQLPAPKTHFHASLDEYYVLNETSFLILTNVQALKFLNKPVSFISSFNGNIFHPPQC